MEKQRPPAIVVGGSANAVSVVRSLSRMGVKTYALNRASEPVRYSRDAEWVKLDGNSGPAAWTSFLLGAESEALRGAVILACSDEALEILIRHGDALSKKFILEEGEPRLRKELLNKLTTYRLAEQAGVPTPGYHEIANLAQLHEVIDDLRFPVIVKPLYSPNAAVLGGRKYILARNRDALLTAAREASELGVGFLVMEYIDGPDSQLSSYYTYMDEDGRPLFHFTKVHPRRNPPNMGPATYHIARWMPETAELGLKFFRHIGFRGLGNIEFKYDPRDGTPKIMECNARFTAATELVTRSGIDTAVLTYRRLTGEQVQPVDGYKQDLRLLFPIEDIVAYRELRKRGDITLPEWIDSLLRADCFPYFQWRDPLPSVHIAGSKIGKLFRKRPAVAGVSARRRTTS